jgi:hypothetical protein
MGGIMRTIRMLSSAVLVGAMAVVTPGGAASAAPATTYTGVFDGGIVYSDCTSTPDPATTTGSWSIMLKRTSTNGTVSSAKGTFDILVNGLPHVSYVYPNMELATAGPNTTFAVSGMTGAGLLTVTLKDNGKMTYKIEPYNYGGLSCTSVTFPGHLTS